MGQRAERFTNQGDGERATNVRFLVLALLTSMSVLLYLDRVCISVAGQRIGDELDLDKVEMGFIYGCFFLAYALAQVPAGWLGDRLGARLVLTACVVAWSLFTGLTVLAVGFLTLTAVRLLFGVSQAGAFPVAARVNSVWMPFTSRGFASSVITLGGRAGGALAPLLTAWLILGFDDWRPVFVVYALVGCAWAVLFWALFRGTPAEHPGCNRAEARLIEGERPAEATASHGRAGAIPWVYVLTSRSMWMQCLTQFSGNIPWTFLVTWLPTYFSEEHGMDLAASGFLSSLPLLAGMCGCVAGGFVTDRLTRRFGLKWGRNILGMGSKVWAALGLLLVAVVGDPLIAVAGLIFMSFAMDTGLGATWAYFQDAGGRYVGTLLGWANMFGNIGSFVSPLLLGWLAQEYGWDAALGVCAALFVVSAVCWYWVDARVPVVPERQGE